MGTHDRLSLLGSVRVAVLNEVLDEVVGRGEVLGADCAVVCVAGHVQARVVRANVLAQHHSLVEGARADRASVRLLARMDPLVLSQSTAVGEGLPAVAASIGSLPRVNAHVDLLRAARPKRLAALVAREEFSRRGSAVRVAVVGKGASVRELLVAHLAHYRFVAVRGHVPLQARFVVEVLAALGARVTLLAGMVPGVLDQGLPVATLLAAENARVGLQLAGVAGMEVSLNGLLFVEANATKDAPEWEN